MSRVVLSVYRCDPGGVSEAYSGFKYAEALAARHEVILCTPSYNVKAVETWLDGEQAAPVRSNIRLFSVPMADVDARLGAFGSAVKPGFFLYESRLVRLLKRSGTLDRADMMWHRTPISFRFRSRLSGLGLPFVTGPLAGGLKPPAALSEYFEKESALYRLRRLDGLLLRSRFWMAPLDRAARVLIACDYVADILPRRFKETSTTILDTGIDIVAGDHPPRDRDTFEALFVGRLVRYKGPLLALEAFARFLQLEPQAAARAHLTIVGDGPEATVLAASIERLGLSERVVLTGALPRAEALKRYGESDVFVFPAVTEASGNVYLEAMAAGLPLVVVSHGGGACIPSDAAAFKIPVAGREALVDGMAGALQELYADSNLRTRMGRASRECVSENYTWDVLGKRICEIVDEVCAGR